MKTLYPRSFDQIGQWSHESGLAPLEARQRFAQFAVLRAIASSSALSGALVLKGGNALDFVWQPARSTIDLDFSVDGGRLHEEPNEDSIRSQLEPALAISTRRLGVALRTQSIDRQPPGAEKTFVTYRVKVGYALPDDGRQQDRIRAGQPVSSVIPLDISLNERICAASDTDVGGTFMLRVSTLLRT